MNAYDLWFEVPDGIADHPRRPAAQARPAGPADGWIGSAGPGIDPTTWPRGTQTGLPMFHGITLLLPPEFRRRGPDLPAVAFFQGEGQFAAPRGVDDPDDPFVVDLARAVDHPHLARRVDIIDGEFALVRLTQDEYDAGPTPPPADPRGPGTHGPDDEGPNAWDTQEPTRRVWLLGRPDLNAGHVPVDALDAASTPGFVTPFDDGFHLLPWAQALAPSHLGGTAFPIQALQPGFTPYYLELDELPGMNFGSGSAQVDLESDAFDWAC
ncbi:hypothetical protein [Cellulomonas fimi]|uniref:NUDIX hydrolase n=1 Tax=Cellulomonas fimi (strain ATCC 484 / DSM 20113 / JCM 1341 / CCUG 24087 / LMG 16345 / NBRC 15513 / NCIMB 8980 / NCTC 7547 / NRS-133) TaxID=590998 RepID=F4H846_CELFA|nr:hypothetical protein [Cellulomonas fimi]AEE44603.1 NUDIX hydrolase [Cellulomonas fimi ATCC 484]NNH09042.1 hypothetical protein [Cellulomonas fimi]VEH26754.1 Uncharacterised protein [Cellulomonas fimi]